MVKALHLIDCHIDNVLKVFAIMNIHKNKIIRKTGKVIMPTAYTCLKFEPK